MSDDSKVTVARRCSVPNNNMAIKRVLLVPVDASDASDRALEWASTQMYKPGDVIHILHVSKTLTPHCDIQHSKLSLSPSPLPPLSLPSPLFTS